MANSLHTAFGQALAAFPHFSQDVQALTVAEGGDALVCRLVALDSLAASFLELRLETPRLAGATPEELKALSERLSQRLNYLLEPIRPIELDAERCVVQLRSLPPGRDQDRTLYYELLAQRGGWLQLTRYSQGSGQPREPVSAQVTREVLLRLAGDLASAV